MSLASLLPLLAVTSSCLLGHVTGNPAPQPYHDEILQVAGRIINGQESEKHDHPYIASLQFDWDLFCYDKADEMVKKSDCYNYLTMEWSNIGYCENAKEDYKKFRDGVCKGMLVAFNWNFTNDDCLPSDKTTEVFDDFIGPCFDSDNIEIKRSKHCLEARDTYKEHFGKCIQRPIFEPMKPSPKYQGWKHQCGGALIKDDWVVTAAHCVDQITQPNLKYWRLVLGEHNVTDVEDNTEVIREISEVIVFPGYRNSYYNHDIALLKLKEKVKLTCHIHTIKISESKHDDPILGERCVLAGWGRITGGSDFEYPENLQEIELTTIPLEECREVHVRIAPVTRNMVCVQSARNDTADGSACHGDSGGPMVCDGRLAGVTSWGHPWCNGDPSVYTRISSYAEWILNHTSENQEVVEAQKIADKICEKEFEETGNWECEPFISN